MQHTWQPYTIRVYDTQHTYSTHVTHMHTQPAHTSETYDTRMRHTQYTLNT